MKTFALRLLLIRNGMNHHSYIANQASIICF